MPGLNLASRYPLADYRSGLTCLAAISPLRPGALRYSLVRHEGGLCSVAPVESEQYTKG